MDKAEKSAYNKIYYAKNKEKLRIAAAAYRKKNEEHIKEKRRLYHAKNKEKSNATCAAYQKKNKERIAERKRLARLAKPEEERQRIDREHRAKNRERIRDRNREYSRRNRAEDPKAAIKNKLSSRIRVAIKQHKGGKALKSEDLLGASISEVMEHLESQFQEGMTWENHGRYGWHIDHIMPCASFDLTLESEQKKCFNYKNLQPLWWRDNLSKSDKIITASCHKSKTKEENQQRRKNK